MGMDGGGGTTLICLAGCQLHLDVQAVDSLLQDNEREYHAIIRLSVACSIAAIPSPM